MVFTGWSLSSLLTLGGIAGGLVVIFYILKLRRRPVAVPFARIWERILRDKEATHLFSQLKRLLSLLLQLALLTLLLIALGDPRLSAATLEGRNIVVLVDTSASMKSTDVEPTRLGAAREQVRELTAGLANADRMLIARMDAVVSPLTTMTDDIASLDAALDQLEATDTRADLERGLRFALDSLRGLSRPEVVLVGDGAYGDLAGVAERVELGDLPVSFVPVGKEKRNVAITQFSVRRYPLDKSRYEVMLEVTNTTDEPVDVELTLLGDGNIVDLTRLHLEGNERLPRFYQDLAGAD
jgi:Ca-activated chloride channel family protein